MKSLLRLLCCFLLCAPLLCTAADSPSPLVRSLKGRIVFLRGMESGDKLSFDAKGGFLGTGPPLPFAHSTVLVEKVRESNIKLEIKGERVVLAFLGTPESISDKDFHYVRLREHVTITFAIGSSAPDQLDAAIDKAFAFTAQDDLAGRPIPEVQEALCNTWIDSSAR